MAVRGETEPGRELKLPTALREGHSRQAGRLADGHLEAMVRSVDWAFH